MRNWDMKFKGVSFYPYLRSLLPGEKLTVYQPIIKVSRHDILGLISLVSLLFKTERTVVFVPDRNELIRFVAEKFPLDTVVFVRREVHRGNVFFIEAIRFGFRLYARVGKGNFFKLKDPRFIKRTHDFIGDVLFNKYFLYPLLRKHKVFFSNCVVPLCEKYQTLYDSCEIQHGVIYKGHHDYTNIPAKIHIGPILAWNDFFARVLLEDCKYPGIVTSANFNFYEDICSESTNYGLILSTVDHDVSLKIIKQLNHEYFILRRHPRDKFDYGGFVGQIDDAAPLRRYSRIFCSDTTLIYSLKLHRLFFYYLLSDGDNENLIILRLKEKYNVDFGKDYDFF